MYQMNPYQNFQNQNIPTYGNQNPYLQRYQQQIPVQQIQQNTLIGRMINSFDDITAGDVPDDGTIAIFPKCDLSELQIRVREANGIINPITYKPFKVSQNEKASISSHDELKSFLEEIRVVVGGIEERLTSIEKSISPKTRTKKVVSDDE